MPGIGNNLYPPICSTYMPAFVRTTACHIYFSLSNYNSAEDIKNVQVVISNQNTNLSALAVNLYPAGIKLVTLQKDESVTDDAKYFITINPEDLQSGVFELNQYYKVQLRFTGTGATDLSDANQISKWLIDNQKFFSEWSTVCLVRGIQQPQIYLKGFEDAATANETIFTSEVVEFVGSMYYDENEEIEKEYLKSYRIQIKNNSSNKLAYDSGDIYTNKYNPNEINYTLKTALEDGVSYGLILTYNTINEYSNSFTSEFSIIQNSIDALKATITATEDAENARIRIDVVATIEEAFFGNLTIRRSSNESNFTIWEDVHQVTIVEGKPLNYTWYDYTVKSGVWYKYCAQQRNSKGDRGAVISIRFPIMAIFEDMFLTRGNLQVKLKYDPNISTFKKTLLESKTDTLGSQYPIIRRNGNVGYKQFPISGLITAFCDEEGVFINKERIYGDSISYYTNYNEENNITEYQDFIYEREFREKVMDFLQDGNIKLFKSTTEGNILVRLMDISFTPNQTLGRMLYSFSATAYEIDECTLEKCEKYGIQSIGNYSSYLMYSYPAIGQLQGSYVNEKQDILTIIQSDYTDRATEKYINTVKYLKWIRIEFNMPPYLIKTAANGSIMPLPATEKPDENTALGYIVYINNKPILVSSRGYYELIDPDTEITSIVFPVLSTVTIDYMARIDQTENTSLLYSKMYYSTKIGQMSNTFNFKENVFLRIYQKYLLNYIAYHQQLLSLDKVSIEAVPGTVVYVRDSFDDDFFKHEVGSTGVLEFYDEEAIVTGLKFGGIQLYEASEEAYAEQIVAVNEIEKTKSLIKQELSEVKDNAFEDLKDENTLLVLNAKYFKIREGTVIVETHEEGAIKDNEFRIVPNEAESLKDIIHPIKNGIYTIDNSKYIFYHANWYTFSDDNIIECPTDAMIDYIYEVMKGEF